MQRSSILWMLTVVAIPAVALIGGPATLIQPPAAPEKSGDKKSAETQDLSWLPKAETGALDFLKANPEADGRGIVVAIFDTGVDPGAAGLQTTPDGRPKIIDIIDGTGSGDVTMNKPVKAEENKLTGLTGRELTINPDWKNPSGEFRLGMKSGYDLFPSELISVIKAEREEDFKKKQYEHKAELQRKLAKWKAENAKPDDKQKETQKELEAQIKLLDELLKAYSDPGPIFDCVVFNDGEHFRAVIDTDEDGDLAEEEVLTNFRAERQYDTFADPINMNFGVNIYREGELLSIVCDTGAHGTHCAGITAAYYPDQPEWNGVAPGAQIVSVKIGDTRLDGMENGPGLVRGLKAVLDNKCDLINMSYGEPTTTPGVGRVAELYSEIVNEHDVIFVSSAGNAGPALSTVGAPGGTTSALIGVGAYVSPEMARSEYSLRQKTPGLPYTWTSRGPTVDGDLGVDIFAPGGAIAPVPQWTRQANQQMNGTSMASPNACGNIALMLSLAKQKELKYTPHSVRKAIQATAQELPDAEVFAAGPGLIQIDRAWKHLESYGASYAQQLDYKISLPTLGDARGIYLREPHQTQNPTNFRTYINVALKEKAAIAERLDVNLTFTMKSTADWATCGDLLHLQHAGNRFDIEVDPTKLKPGVHYAEVQGFQQDNMEAGPVFRVPITVVIPVKDQEIVSAGGEMTYKQSFEPGIVTRHFYDVPTGASWAELKMTLTETPEPKFFRVHTLQLVEGEHFEHGESGTYYQLIPDVETVHSFPVIPGRTLEVDLAQYWSILGDSNMEYSIRFHGGQPDDPSLTLATGQGVAAVTVHNELAGEKITPSASLKTWRRILSQEKQEIAALSRDRDQLPNGSSVYEATMTYELSMPKKGSVTLRLPGWENLLYDAPIGPFIYHVKDKNGKRVTTNDMFADPVSLEKGSYTIELVTQHSDPSKLEMLKDAPLTAEQSLGSPISLSIWSSAAAAAWNNGKAGAELLESGESTTVYVGEPDTDKLPKELSAGDMLLGSIKFSDDEAASTHYEVKYSFAKPAEESSSSSGKSDKKLDEQIRELKLTHLESLDVGSEEFNTLFAELREADAEDNKPLMIKLKKLDTDDERKKNLAEIIKTADELIATYDQNQMAATLGKRVPSDDKEAKKAHDEAESKKKELIDVLYRKVRAIAYRELPDVVAEQPIENQEEQDKQFDASLKELETWVDVSGEDYFLVHVRKARRAEHYAQAIQALNKQIDADAPFLYYKKRRDMLEQLGWEEWRDWQQQQMLLNFPEKHPPYK